MLKLSLDIDKVLSELKEFEAEVNQDVEQSIRQLAASTYAKVAEMANGELSSTRQTFMDNLGFEEIAPGLWCVFVSEKALFIEEGIEANKDMKPDLLKNATMTSKDGHKYRAIPFKWNKNKSSMTPQAQDLVGQLKSELRKQKIPYKKIEKIPPGQPGAGSPRLGKLHTLNLGGPIPGKGNTPAFQRLSIYQTLNQKTGKVSRHMLTYRTVSDGPKSADKWIHPGLEAKKYLDKALEWAEQRWEQDILPTIIDKWSR
jgi:hypothetical protein